MKVMHLSDLHLGKNILEQSLISDQEYILKQIINIIKDQNIDVVLVAGDVYDKGIPNIEAVKLFSNFLAKLYNMRVKVFVIAGNHDSKDRLIFGNKLFIDNGVYIEGIFNDNLKCVTLSDEYGEFNIYMLPFVKPADVRPNFLNEKIESYDDAVRCVINNTKIDKNKRNIIMIHQFCTATGVDLIRSDSENISLGGIDNIDVSIFDSFDYVAMGHIHRPQKLLKETIRYAGSPLKYSFSEVNHKKSVPIIEFREKGDISIKLVDLNPLRDMVVIKGKIDDLVSKDYINNINKDDYIHAIITDEDYIMDAIGKLRSVYKNILKLEYDNTRINGIGYVNQEKIVDVKKFSEFDLFKDFYFKQNNINLDIERESILKNTIKDIKE